VIPANEHGRPAGDGPPIRLGDRVLAEAVRVLEQDGAVLFREDRADEIARVAGGDFEHRVVRRASALSAASSLREALTRVRSATLWIIVAAVALAVITGAGAARAALGEGGAPGGDHAINFFWVLTSLLGAQTLLLLGWILLIISRPRAVNVSPLGGAALAVGRWVVSRTHHEPLDLAAVHAVAGVSARGAIGRWTLSAIGHALWMLANAACVVLLIVLLSTRQYTFHWETTILSADAYESMTRVVARLPHAIGFATPSPAEIAATEVNGASGGPEAARGWSGLLVGAIVTYGLLPRLILFVACMSMRERSRQRYRLDLAAPGYVRLRERLMPEAESRGVIASPGTVPAAASAPAGGLGGMGGVAAPAEFGGGPPALLGLEIETPAGAWPPAVDGASWLDLGFVDGRDDRRRVLAQLRALDAAPRVTAVVCALTTTPDRGLESFLRQITGTAGGPVALLLTAGQALRARATAAQVAQRVDDFRGIAVAAGVHAPQVLEIDLDHVTDASRARLATVLGLEVSRATGGRRLERAFTAIAAAARGWSDAPDTRTQAKLHAEIAGIYEHAARTWRDLLPTSLESVRAEDFRSGIDHVVGLLPDRLKRSPKWLAAGAVTGAIGCIAVATVLTPVAIGALPIWSVVGAAIAAAVQPAGGIGSGGGGNGRGDAAGSDDAAAAVRSATLFALLLEMQGREEAVISRVLDRAVGDDADEPAGTECADWLDGVRHRVDLALAQETTP